MKNMLHDVYDRTENCTRVELYANTMPYTRRIRYTDAMERFIASATIEPDVTNDLLHIHSATKER